MSTLPEPIITALDTTNPLTQKQTADRAMCLIRHMEKANMISIDGMLPQNLLWDKQTLDKSVAPFKRLVGEKIYSWHISDRPVPQSLGTGILHCAWAMYVELKDEEFFPETIFAAVNATHGKEGGRGYNPFFWVFTKCGGTNERPFRSAWANNNPLVNTGFKQMNEAGLDDFSM